MWVCVFEGNCLHRTASESNQESENERKISRAEKRETDAKIRSHLRAWEIELEERERERKKREKDETRGKERRKQNKEERKKRKKKLLV